MSKKGTLIILFIISFVFIVLFSLQSFSAAVVSHYANQIRPGMFGQNYVGNWSFMNGNVGIGVANPNAALYVYQPATLSDVFVVNTSGTGSGALFRLVSGTQTRVYVDKTNGFVGIGTTSPSQALHVIGAAYTSGGLSTAGTLNAASWSVSNTNENGYAKMANIYIQWGKYLSTTDSDQTFDFPTSFPNGCRVVIPSIDLGHGYMAPSCTKTNFTINRADTIDGDQYFNIIAIGY